MQRTIHVDAALTNVSIAYKPTGLIADMLSPVIKVVKDSDKYYEWDKATDLSIPSDRRAPGAEANLIDMKATPKNYSAEEYALKTKVTDFEKRNADSILKLEISKAQNVKTKLMLAREKRVADNFRDATAYDSTNKVTLSGTSQWNNGSYTGNPIDLIDTAIEAVRSATGMRPNVIVIPGTVANVFKNNAKVIELLKYTHATLLEGTGLPNEIRGLKLLVPGAVYNTANEGAAASLADVWGKDIFIGYINYDGNYMDNISFSYTFRSQEMETRKWRDEAIRSDLIETSYVEDHRLVAPSAGYLIKNVIS